MGSSYTGVSNNERGFGGGGDGGWNGTNNINPQNGMEGTGGGGGGAQTSTPGANGGSGIVLIKYIENRDFAEGYISPYNVLTITPTVIPEKIDNEFNVLTFTYDANAYPNIYADTTNLVAWYKFDDDTNKGLNSSVSPNSIGDAGYNGNPTLNSSEYVIGKSSYFSGNGDHSFVLDNSSRNLYDAIYQKPITIAFWCKSIGLGQQNFGRIFYGAANGLGNNINSFQCVHWSGTDDGQSDNAQLTFIISNNGESFAGNYMYSTQLPAFNTAWSYIAFVIEPQSTNWTTKEHMAKIYVNGVLDKTYTNIWYPSITTTYNFEIGRWTTNEDSREYNGYLDDFRIYNKALSHEEITDLYSQYSQTQYKLTFDNPSLCDILMIGGGGGGGRRMGGGGGAGALIYDTFTFLANTTYTLKVGKGGEGVIQHGNRGSTPGATYENKVGDTGGDTEILQGSTVYYRATGGGGGAQEMHAGDGGSSGGAGGKDGYYGGLLSSNNIVNGTTITVSNNTRSHSTDPSYDSDKIFGNEGGRGNGNAPWGGGGGGGANNRGTDSHDTNPSTNNVVRGGDGKYSFGTISFKTHFGITDTNIGHHYNGEVYFAGGGGGGNWASTYYNDGGLGGGGRSGINSGNRLSTINALPNTGGGGGGDGADIFQGGNGGSGIILIRYSILNVFSITRYIIYKHNGTTENQSLYNLTFTEDIETDILIVGGGGGGKGYYGGGGGAGGLASTKCIFDWNIKYKSW